MSYHVIDLLLNKLMYCEAFQVVFFLRISFNSTQLSLSFVILVSTTLKHVAARHLIRNKHGLLSILCRV